MAEKTLWAYLREGMRGRWADAMRIECMLNKGVADVSFYLEGNQWMELKEIKKAPARDATQIRLGRWRDLSQRHFLIKRHGWLFIRVNYPHRFYMLFRYDNLPPDTKPFWSLPELCHNAYYVWTNRIDFDMLAQLLRGNHEVF